MTAASAFSDAALTVTSIGLATGITLRALHRRPYPPMLALLIAGGVLQVISRTLTRDWFDVYLGLAVTAAALGMLARDAAKAPQ